MTLKEKVLKTYQLRFDEINELTETVFTSFSEDEESARRKFEESLFWAFVEGYQSGKLQKKHGKDSELDEIIEGLSSGILDTEDLPNGYEFLDITYPDGETVLQKFDKYYAGKDTESIRRLIESEAGRMFNTASIEAVKGSKGTKTWCAVLDNKTRETHEILDGTTIPIDDYFVSTSGDTALAPCMFETADENCNCRCCLLFDS